jgi:hypothetical protein
MARVTIRKGWSKSRTGRPDFYVVTTHTGKKIQVSTKERAEEIASASRRVRTKHRKAREGARHQKW